MIKPPNKTSAKGDNSSNKSFDGTFGHQDILDLLKTAKGKSRNGKSQNLLQNVVTSNVGEVFRITPAELVYMQQNYSGTRLSEELRKKLPGIIPSQRMERFAKKELQRDFKAILLPLRTSSGWQIDAGRMMEILSFKYYQIQDSKHWKVYGDGREICGRQSTFIAISLLNNETFYHDLTFQSPKNIHPVNIFYESDSRDNLEENLGMPCKLDECFKRKPQDTFYLSGDEIFLEAVLNGSGELGPTTNTGWNIYHTCDKNSKAVTANTGSRTDLSVRIDRVHDECLFTTIPTERTVLCALHAIARCVEKLLNLEIENILSEANKISQRGGDGDGFREDAIYNLENSICQRGVRHANFRVLFDKSGKPEPVSLSKDHALGIIMPPFPGYVHVLHNVVGNRRVDLQISTADRQQLDIANTYSEFQLAAKIWNQFYQMSEILLKDPLPNKHPENMNWEEREN